MSSIPPLSINNSVTEFSLVQSKGRCGFGGFLTILYSKNGAGKVLSNLICPVHLFLSIILSKSFHVVKFYSMHRTHITAELSNLISPQNGMPHNAPSQFQQALGILLYTDPWRTDSAVQNGSPSAHPSGLEALLRV